MVDGQNGRLIYKGYVIADLAESMTFEEVAYLLWYGELPNQGQLDELSAKMRAHRKLNPAGKAALEGLANDTHPMDVLRTVISAHGAAPKLTKPDIEQSINLAAIFPTILASFHRRRTGKEVLESRDDLGHAANYLYMLTGEQPTPGG